MAAAAVAVKRAGCVLRLPPSPAPVAASGGRRAPRPEPPKSGPAAAASQDPLHPSRIRLLSRAGLIPGFLLSALFDVVVFFLSGLSAVRHCCPPRTPESQVETNGQVVPGPEYESPNLNGSIGTSSPQEHLTGKELLDSSAKRCMEQYAEIFSQVVAVQKIKARKKKDCHSTVFERLDGVMPLLRLQH
ncbi:uncharacterized protein LOC120664002 isoform X2 [Panicum virgatum]|uniref:uncharacterized protein LOC120664002 isoform X2 n=1 Tax=Panicum virgatum TaxID=38727 RepID=UPI0019D683F5|nr:uncharacterized protein LOC120664002 isoform X2 [Panicum virgatum]XP_039798898.1 uncharacterized protein LOC120664002 isoform X2 [Panicum virgatum]